jgi:CDP-glycerol glycerophosphotransferase
MSSPGKRLRPTRRRRPRVRRIAAKFRRVARREALRRYYRLQLRQPIEPDLVVFAAYWYRDYACNPRALFEKLRELVPSVRGVWVVDRDHVARIPEGVEHVVSGTRPYYRLIARAKYFVNNVNFPNEFVKRPGTIHVQTHHGTPLKTMGLDQRNAFVARSRMNFDRLLRRSARWDYSISSNEFSTRIWARAYPTPYETLEVGYPRNDTLVNATEEDVARIRNELGIAAGRRAVLFAPTHREYLREYAPTADIQRLSDELGPAYVIMLRVHYFYGSDVDYRPDTDGRILDVSAHPSVEELCIAADALVTDYSSIMFDYAVLDRPIVIHAPDWAEYRKLRGTYFDLLSEPPGVVTTSDEELAAAFRSGAFEGEEANRLRATFRTRFCALEDGRAAERVVRRVWLEEQESDSPPAAPTASPREIIEA